MKNILFLLLFGLLLSCSNEDITPYQREPEVELTDEVDKWFYENLQQPYNCVVRWKWDDNYVSINYYVTPPRKDIMIPVGEMIKTFWVEPFIEAGGEDFIIEQPFMCDYGYNIEIGENFYANHNLIILDGNKVKFGSNVFIAPNCSFYTAGHPLEVEKRNEGLEYAKAIEVGDNVWIGGNVVVLPGVKIGSNTIIGAGSIVTKDIPSNVVAVGNPCKVIKKL